MRLTMHTTAQELHAIKEQINSREKVTLTEADLVWIQMVILDAQAKFVLDQVTELSDLLETLTTEIKE